MNYTLGQMNLTDIHRPFHTRVAEYTFFSSTHTTFSRIDHILGHKTNFKKLRKLIAYQVSFPITIV